MKEAPLKQKKNTPFIEKHPHLLIRDQVLNALLLVSRSLICLHLMLEVEKLVNIFCLKNTFLF